MNTHEPLTDAELEAMLARLTARGQSEGLEASIMASVETTPQLRGSWVTWPDWRFTPAPVLRPFWLLAVLGLLLVLAAGTLVVGSRLFIDAEAPPIFSWARDDLREWVTEDEMTDILTVMSVPYFGAELDGDVGSRVSAADWVLSFRLADGAGSWRLLVHNGNHGGAYLGPPKETDPRLANGVTYEAEWGFGHGGYILSGPHSRELLALHLLPPGTSFGYPHGTEVEVHEDRIFALASMMLREMGWAD
jgi:hypothetical protein